MCYFNRISSIAGGGWRLAPREEVVAQVRRLAESRCRHFTPPAAERAERLVWLHHTNRSAAQTSGCSESTALRGQVEDGALALKMQFPSLRWLGWATGRSKVSCSTYKIIVGNRGLPWFMFFAFLVMKNSGSFHNQKSKKYKIIWRNHVANWSLTFL